MEQNKYYVYEHRNPVTLEVFYIGVGKEGTKRSIVISGRNKHWKNLVKSFPTKFICNLLFRDLSLVDAEKMEMDLISKYGRKGYEANGILVNILPGGRLQSRGPNGIPNWSEEVKQKMSNSHLGNLSNTGRICITNGTLSTYILKEDSIPEGWWRGGLKRGNYSQEFREKCSKNKKGKKLNLSQEEREARSKRAKEGNGSAGNYWINNGLISKYIKSSESIPEGWTKGRLRTWINQFEKLKT